MTGILALLGGSIFTVIGLWHLYWALGGKLGLNAAIPEIDGAPAFAPAPLLTGLVGVAILGFALLLAATAGLVTLPVPDRVLVWLCRGLGLVLLLRAIGDFKVCGFTKRLRTTRFARLDTLFYSPLCLLLAAIALSVGFVHP